MIKNRGGGFTCNHSDTQPKHFSQANPTFRGCAAPPDSLHSAHLSAPKIELNNRRSSAVSKMNMIRSDRGLMTVKTFLSVATLALLTSLGCSTDKSAAPKAVAEQTKPTPSPATTAAPATATPAKTPVPTHTAATVPAQVIETGVEFLVSGDFNGDG